MAIEVSRPKSYGEVAELRAAIIEAWNSIEMATLNRFIDTMPDRIFAVINHNGASTKY
jgi:hypothetical protein